MRRARAANARRAWTSAATLPGFDPRDVPAVAAGRFWLANRATGLGGTGFAVPEGNGNTPWNVLQATVANQPDRLTENGGVQFRHRNSADPNPVTLASAGNVQAGWTGDTYFAGWFRMPGGDVTGTSTHFSHNLTTGNQRRIIVQHQNGTPDTFTSNLSVDGTNVAASGFATSAAVKNGLWQWVELLIRPTITAADVHEHYSNLVEQALVTVPTVSMAALFDATAPIRIACNAAAANADVMDWAAIYLGNGIPSLFHRQRLMAHQAPIATAFM